MSEGREDSPTAGSETISETSGEASRNGTDRQPAVGDDLVSVDRHGKVTVESGSGAGPAIYWALKNVLLGPAITKIFRPIHEGAENVPDEGAAIVASNHLSFADWVFMPIALDRRITFVAKSDYFTRAGIKGWAQKRFFAGTGQVPIDRSGGRASGSAIQAGLKVLQRGELFGIYPEGTRSHDGRLYKGRTGVARLALLSGAPVIPSAILGTDIIAPPGKILTKVVSPDREVRTTIGFLPLQRDERGSVHPAFDHRRDHVRDHGAIRPGVCGHVRAGGEGGRGAGSEGARGRRSLSSGIAPCLGLRGRVSAARPAPPAG